jgi:hypothetical protein
VKVEVLLLAGLDEPVVLLRIEPHHPGVLLLGLLGLDLAPADPGILLDLARRRVKRLGEHPDIVVVGLVQALLALDHDVAPRHADAEADADRALVRLLVRRLDHHPGADDAVVIALEPLEQLAHALLEGGRALHVVERDLKGFLHAGLLCCRAGVGGRSAGDACP